MLGKIKAKAKLRNMSKALKTDNQKKKKTLFFSSKVVSSWINKIYAYRGILSVKRNKILTNATIGMNLENIILNEISQTQKRQILYDSTSVRFLD